MASRFRVLNLGSKVEDIGCRVQYRHGFLDPIVEAILFAEILNTLMAPSLGFRL